MGNFFNWIRRRFQNPGKYQVEVHVLSDYHDKAIAKFYVTTDAKSKAQAKRNVEKDLRLSVGKMIFMKHKINGHA
ncbi:MAG: hypothetical protein ACK5OS_02495 [Chryseotalea sp.]|jgi:hypothetical protein